MIEDRLGVILARSGSKGLPDKNIICLNGKPLMSFSILAAIKSGVFSRIMVSTDSDRYAKIAREYGAEVPFFRSKDSSSDGADKWDAVRDVLKKYAEMNTFFQSVCVLQPTSPLRNEHDIKEAYTIFDDKRADAVVSVCECDHPPVWSGRIGNDGNMDNFNKPEMFLPRQELGLFYRLNGAIFIAKTDVIYERRSIYEKDCFAYVMDRERSIDIDSLFDLKVAKILMEEHGL